MHAVRDDKTASAIIFFNCFFSSYYAAGSQIDIFKRLLVERLGAFTQALCDKQGKAHH